MTYSISVSSGSTRSGKVTTDGDVHGGKENDSKKREDLTSLGSDDSGKLNWLKPGTKCYKIQNQSKDCQVIENIHSDEKTMNFEPLND